MPTRPHYPAIQCKAMSRRTGEQCKQYAMKGQLVCRMHGGSTKAARAKGKETVTAYHLGQKLAKLDVDLTNVSPEEGLLTEVARSRATVDALAEMVQGEDRLEQRLDSGNRPTVLVALYNEERDRHAKLCKMALDAGIAERQIQLAEAQAGFLVRIIIELLTHDSLALSPEQVDAGRRVAAQLLRAMPA